MNQIDKSNSNMTNLIINYLPQTYTDDEMYTLFSTIGEVVNCKIIRDKTTGYSYGFGFVEYSTSLDADNAIRSLNGCEIENKRIKVALARPPGENTKGANLYIRNVPVEFDEMTLRDLFTQYGNIVQARILMDHLTGHSKGVGFVLFETKADADRAMKEMHGTVPPGGVNPFIIKFADDNAKKVRAPPQENQGYGRGRGGYGGQGAPYSAQPRPGGPMRGPGGLGRMRYNPMSAGRGAPRPEIDNGYQGGYTGGYAEQNYNPARAGRAPAAAGVGGGGHHVARALPAAPTYGQFGGGDASSGTGVILFVYNIGVDATESDLWNLFCPYGTVEKVNVIWDHAQDKCKGYGFVTMSTMEEALYAIEYLNGFYYKTVPLQVSIKSDKK